MMVWCIVMTATRIPQSEAESQSVAVFVLRRDLLLRRLDGLLLLVLRCVGALARDFMAQRGGQLLAVIGEELRIVRSARDGDISHAVVEQVLRAQLRIDMH